MDINGSFNYELSGYHVAVEVSFDDNGVYMRDFANISCDGVDSDLTDDEIAVLTEGMALTLEEESADGTWAERIAAARDDEKIADDSGPTLGDHRWAPQLNSMPSGYQVH